MPYLSPPHLFRLKSFQMFQVMLNQKKQKHKTKKVKNSPRKTRHTKYKKPTFNFCFERQMARARCLRCNDSFVGQFCVLLGCLCGHQQHQPQPQPPAPCTLLSVGPTICSLLSSFFFFFFKLYLSLCTLTKKYL